MKRKSKPKLIDRLLEKVGLQRKRRKGPAPSNKALGPAPENKTWPRSSE
jgi:hypothetical protein